MKVCKKCKAEFKNCVMIDGKRKNLKNRTFCLTCSPWGQHNTKDLLNGEVIEGKRRCPKCGLEKDASLFYKKPKGRFHSFCKECLYETQKDRWTEKKKEAIRFKGGKCISCGYDKNFSAMIFHHRDPTQKEFDWNRLRLQSKETTQRELEKCDLYCCRCHFELHNPDCLM